MLLYLARHGQTESDAGGIPAGDEPVLTELGWEQAKRLARRIADESPGHVYAGPHPRSLQTVEAIRDESQSSMLIHPIFCEQWETGTAGWPRWQLQESFPWAGIPEMITDEAWWPAQAETEMEVFVRAGRALQLLRERHPARGERILVVSHNTFGAVLLSAMFGLPPCSYSRFMQRNASVSLAEVWEDGARLHYLNDVSHLPLELRK